MKALPNIKLVPFEMNTYSLIQHSKFVATITGTAGWEAVSGGKSAVIFGQAWYTNFPGVFQYTETLDPYALANYEIDHDALEGAVSRLISRTGQGVLDPNFIATSAYKDNFDGKKNVHTLAKSLAKIIAHQDAMDTESSELTTKLQEPELVLTARQDTGEPYAP
jgi:capsule polysaccharide export protein KpsC/LpsZ